LPNQEDYEKELARAKANGIVDYDAPHNLDNLRLVNDLMEKHGPTIRKELEERRSAQALAELM